MATLRVRDRGNGPIIYARWRDRDGRSVERPVGPGWLVGPREGEAKPNGRRIGEWRERRGRAPDGFLTVQDALEQLGDVRERFLFTLFDCPPSLGPLTVNALVAADRVIVPVQTEYFALEGLAGLLDTLSLIQRELNPRLAVAGMILTMHDGRTRLAQDVEREVREHFPELVFDTVIPRNVRVGEAPSFGLPVTRHDPTCSGSLAYLKLAKEVAARG